MDGHDPWRALAEVLLGPPTLTPAEVASAAGLDLEMSRDLWRALGFPPVANDERLFTERDVEILRGVRAVLEIDVAEQEDLIQLTRVIGQALSRVADAQVTASAERLERMQAPGTPLVVDPAAIAERVATLAPRLEQFLAYVWRRHLLAALRRRAAQPSAVDRTLAVGFADLVGFTVLSQALAPHELARAVDRFEAVAYEHVPEHGGRVVKMNGDEVMFAADDDVRAAEIALSLAEAYAREDDLPGVRVGLASGPVLSWEGDLYGPTVNLASRLVNLARPNTVLVSDELGRALSDVPGFVLKHLRPVNLQGFGRVRSWVLRRAADAERSGAAR
jgi:adenylate cyclase